MMLTSQQMAHLCSMTKRGFLKMVHRMSIPFSQEGSAFLFDVDTPSDFFTSIKQAMFNKELKPIYSLRDIARLLNKNKRTIYSLLINKDIPIHFSGKKILIFLVNFNKLRLKTLKRAK